MNSTRPTTPRPGMVFAAQIVTGETPDAEYHVLGTFATRPSPLNNQARTRPQPPPDDRHTRNEEDIP